MAENRSNKQAYVLRLLLKVLHGPLTGSSFFLEPERPVWIGRDEDAPIPIDDPMLSRAHFELDFDGSQCLLRDLESTNGTRVNGKRVSEVVLENGDVIEAGDNRFKVEIQKQGMFVPAQRSRGRLRGADESPNSLPELPVAEMRLSDFEPTPLHVSLDPFLKDRQVRVDKGSLLDRLTSLLDRSEASHLYGLVDGAQDYESAYRGRLMGSDLYTLFAGEQAEALAHVGPCLLDLENPLPFLDEWTQKIGRHIGVLMEAAVGLPELCRHLREIFIVTDETGQELFFRYYDPRVFRGFLPTCTPEELKEFFGPVDRWIVEDEEGESYEIYELEDSQLRIRK